jgi:hypothetical protein
MEKREKKSCLIKKNKTRAPKLKKMCTKWLDMILGAGLAGGYRGVVRYLSKCVRNKPYHESIKKKSLSKNRKLEKKKKKKKKKVGKHILFSKSIIRGP